MISGALDMLKTIFLKKVPDIVVCVTPVPLYIMFFQRFRIQFKIYPFLLPAIHALISQEACNQVFLRGTIVPYSKNIVQSALLYNTFADKHHKEK